jgi:hypothetical protein
LRYCYAVSTAYELILLARDDAWAHSVESAVRDALVRIVGNGDAVAFARAVPQPSDVAKTAPHAVVAFLADEASRAEAGLLDELEAARRQAMPVLPLVHPGANVFAMLPEPIRPLNAVEWSDPPGPPTQAILRLFGLVEAERRLFLSYRRNESSALALQLRRALSERAYDVFLDRFSVPPAADFQHRIDVELSDKAFVLLLESPSVTDSEWVQHEVVFALAHQISLLALVLPDTQPAQRHASIPDALRLELADADLTTGGELRPAALARVLDEVETSYAGQLRRRRAGMLDSLRDWLARAGADPRPADGPWALAAGWPAKGSSVFLITPRAPRPRDVYELDRIRRQRAQAIGAEVSGTLAFGAPVRDADDKALIDWVRERRPLDVRPHLEMKAVLGV